MYGLFRYLLITLITVLKDKQNNDNRNMVCKGICIRHKAYLPVGEGRYVNGQKRCQVCSIFMEWSADTCPCCGIRLRTKSRNYKHKSKFHLSRI